MKSSLLQLTLSQRNIERGLKGTYKTCKPTQRSARPGTGFLMVDTKTHPEPARTVLAQRTQAILATATPKVTRFPAKLPSFKEIKLNRQDKSRQFLRSFKFPIGVQKEELKKKRSKQIKRVIPQKFREMPPIDTGDAEPYLKYIEMKYSKRKVE